MIELILISALSAYAGWSLKPAPEAIPCPPSPIVQVICVRPTPPLDETFGSTTEALVDAVTKYKLCRIAAGVNVKTVDKP